VAPQKLKPSCCAASAAVFAAFADISASVAGSNATTIPAAKSVAVLNPRVLQVHQSHSLLTSSGGRLE